MKQILLIILFLTCVSCASSPKHSRIASFTPAGVVVDYSETKDLIEATEKAQAYCNSAGKDAQYVQHKEDNAWYSMSSKYTAFFNCVSKMHPNAGYNGGGGHTIINNPPAVINNN